MEYKHEYKHGMLFAFRPALGSFQHGYGVYIKSKHIKRHLRNHRSC